PENATS
ncbi:hypothetical protein MUG73_02740, partial [Flavobacterium psychrophilum]